MMSVWNRWTAAERIHCLLWLTLDYPLWKCANCILARNTQSNDEDDWRTQSCLCHTRCRECRWSSLEAWLYEKNTYNNMLSLALSLSLSPELYVYSLCLIWCRCMILTHYSHCGSCRSPDLLMALVSHSPVLEKVPRGYHEDGYGWFHIDTRERSHFPKPSLYPTLMLSSLIIQPGYLRSAAVIIQAVLFSSKDSYSPYVHPEHPFNTLSTRVAHFMCYKLSAWSIYVHSGENNANWNIKTEEETKLNPHTPLQKKKILQ